MNNLGQQYAAAHAAHYVEKNLLHALDLYTAIAEGDPETPEAGYCRAQLQNIANHVVPKPELLAAHVELARGYLVRADPAPEPAADSKVT
jgi:hypothetical protein